MKKIGFNGMYAALVTPITENGSIKEKETERLIAYLKGNGIDGLYIGGSTGEGPLLSIKQRKKMACVVKECVSNDLSVVAHVGSADTNTAVQLAKHAEEIGLDAVSAVPPYYYTMDTESIIAHYTALSKATDLPIIVYSIPQLTGVIMDSGLMERLLSIKNIVGLKYTDLDLYEMRRIKELNNEKTTVFYGKDSSLLAGLVMGADGGIGAFYNIMSKPFVNLYNAFQEGNIDVARDLQYGINHYISICRKYSSISNMFGIKEILKMIGIDAGKVTMPLLPLDEIQTKSLYSDLESAGFFEFIN